MQKKKNVVGENGITIRKSLSREREITIIARKTFAAAYTLRIYQ